MSVLLALAVIAATGLLSATAQAAPRSFYGLIPSMDLQAADYDLIRQANVGAARVPLFWHLIETSEDRYDWSATDGLIGGLAASNVRTLPMLMGTPAWLADTPDKPPVNNARQKAEWREFVSEAVKRYGVGGAYWSSVYPVQSPRGAPLPIDTVQLWNEVNGLRHFKPKPTVGKYSKVLQLGKQGIGDSGTKVDIVTAGLVSKPGKGGIKAWQYLKRLLKKKAAKRSVKHAALHPYAANEKKVFKEVKRMRKALKKGGKKRAELWITEVGWSSNMVRGNKLSKGPKQQAKLLKRTYRGLAKKRKRWKIAGVYWYTWRDSPNVVCDWCPTAGLVTQNRAPKPSYNAYKRVAR